MAETLISVGFYMTIFITLPVVAVYCIWLARK